MTVAPTKDLIFGIGYDWRGHKAYEHPVRNLDALMGHNPATSHLRHYRKWTDEAGLEEEVARATGMNKLI